METVSAKQFPAGPPQGKLAPEGLEPAAPNLLEQVWTGDRGEASGEPRPARPREVHAVTSVGACSPRLPFGSPLRTVQEWVQRLPGGIRPAAFPEERVT